MLEYVALAARLRDLRASRGLTLERVAALTSLTSSTISRIETGKRVPSLEHLVALSNAYGVTLTDLLPTALHDPRIRSATRRVNGMAIRFLSPPQSQISVVEIALTRRGKTDEPQAHEGHEWLYVVSGVLALTLGENEILLGEGEAAEFDTILPHALRAETPSVTALAIYSEEGRRVHFRRV
jgi:transcriptional regulator with XRE-family HTH domain